MLYSTLSFLGCAILIFVSGKNLSRYGRIIAIRMRWEQGWVGLVLMASVTSLPELMVGIGSSSIVGSADLALGDVMGSCAFNLGILSMLDAFVHKRSLLASVSSAHTLAAAMSIILTSLVGLGLYLQQDIVITQWIGFTSILFIVVYAFSMRLLYQYERREHASVPKDHETKTDESLGRATILYLINAVIVVSAAIFLPQTAQAIALETGLGESFVGTLFLAASTSLPEIAVSVAAIRLGALDMATGNLIGSNLFNILILTVDDIFYTKGHILKDASDNNLISVFSVLIMTAIAIAGLTYRSQQKRFLLAWDSLLIFLIYITNIVLLYILRST